MVKKCFKNLVRNIVFGKKRDSKTYVNYLRSIGADIDESVYFVAPTKTLVDLTRPYLLHIGKNVTITEGCALLTHGFDWSVLKVKYGEVLGSAGVITIKDNVFVGVHSIILKGVTIGENTIIGAGSVVTCDIPANVVAAGNPCRVISSIEDYYHKRKNSASEELKTLIREYYNRFHKFPDLGEVSEFFWLFADEEALSHPSVRTKLVYGGNMTQTMNQFNSKGRVRASYEKICEEARYELSI